MENLEKLDTTNQHRTNRGNCAETYSPGSNKPPTYSVGSGTIGESTAHHLEDQPAVKSNQHGDGTGSGGTDD